MSKQIDALKLALEVMRNNGDVSVDEWIATEKAIKEALAQPEQEPVAWMSEHRFNELRQGFTVMTTLTKQRAFEDDIALYTTPPQLKPLTRGQIREIEVDVSLNPSFDYITPAEQLCRAIEAAHGIKGEA